MADHYLEFSEVLPNLTEEEERWLQHQLEFVLVFGDTEYRKDDLPEEMTPADAEWAGCRVYRDMDGYESDFDESAGFNYRFSDDLHGDWCRHLWLYSEEYGCVDRAAHLIQKFLRKFRPHQCWSLTYVTTCSKPRVGEFGGGAVFVTTDDITWHNTFDITERERAAFGKDGEAADEADRCDNVIVVPPTAESVVVTSGPCEKDETRCDCERPGYFCCGVPGILARVENGRLAFGAKIERCDSCQRYASDKAAYEKLVELGMV